MNKWLLFPHTFLSITVWNQPLYKLSFQWFCWFCTQQVLLLQRTSAHTTLCFFWLSWEEWLSSCYVCSASYCTTAGVCMTLCLRLFVLSQSSLHNNASQRCKTAECCQIWLQTDEANSLFWVLGTYSALVRLHRQYNEKCAGAKYFMLSIFAPDVCILNQ